MSGPLLEPAREDDPSDEEGVPRAQTAFLPPVHGAYGDFLDGAASSGEQQQQIVRVAVARPQVRQGKAPRRCGGESRVAALAVVDVQP